MSNSKISIIVPVHSSEATLGECLSAILKSDYKDYELIVVDDCSIDGSTGIARRFPCRLIIHESNRGAAATRNHGAQEAGNEILLFVDSDIVIKPDSASKIIVRFSEDKSLAGASGIYSTYNRFPNFLSQYKHMVVCFRERMCEGLNEDSFKASFLALKKQVFNTHKFDETFKRASVEDIEFGRKLISSGFKFVLDKSNEVEHIKKFTIKTFFKNQYNRSKDIINSYINEKAHRFYYSGRRKNIYAKVYCLRIPIAWMTAASLFIFSITRNPSFVIFSGLLLLISVFLEKGFLKFCYRQKGFMFILGCIAIYFADGLISGLGVLKGLFENYLTRKQR